jgi:hypothetical protein
MPYPAHDAFIAPARARAQLWRLILGLLLILVIYAAGIAAIFGALVASSGLDGAQGWMARMAAADTPTSTLLVLATFLGMGLGPLLVARFLHRRSFGSVIGPRARTLRDFAIAMAICLAIYALLSFLPSGAPAQPNLAPTLWAAFLPLALVGILLQTGAEEVLFRGYLQQQLAARFASPLVWMILPSVLFALGHYKPDTMGDNAWLIVAAVGLFAILAADLTAATGSIGAAWGFHFANNCVAILFVAIDGPLSGLALYTAPFDPADAAEARPLILLDMAITLATWAAIRFAVTRRRG